MALLEFDKDPSSKTLRWFGLGIALFGLVLGFMLEWQFGWTIAARIVQGSALVLAVVYYAVRPSRVPIYLGWMYLAFPIGWVISHVVLGAVYYLIMTPIGLAMRLFGADPMTRRLDRQAKTYWVERPAAGPASRYFKQF